MKKQEEILKELNTTIMLINDHIEYINYKRRNNMILSYSDKQILFNAVTTKLMILQYLKEIQDEKN